jgi:hypothetical protein
MNGIIGVLFRTQLQRARFWSQCCVICLHCFIQLELSRNLVGLHGRMYATDLSGGSGFREPSEYRILSPKFDWESNGRQNGRVVRIPELWTWRYAHQNFVYVK